MKRERGDGVKRERHWGEQDLGRRNFVDLRHAVAELQVPEEEHEKMSKMHENYQC